MEAKGKEWRDWTGRSTGWERLEWGAWRNKSYLHPSQPRELRSRTQTPSLNKLSPL